MAVFWLLITTHGASAGERAAYIFHRIEGSWGESVQFIGVDQHQSVMFHRIKVWPLLPMT